MMAMNPYPGLRPFNDEDEPYFFGREAQIDDMIDRLAVRRFLAVLGASGSGKSSLVNCGLRPALHRGRLSTAGTSWRVARFRPGSAPIQAMARCLARDGLLFPEAGSGTTHVRSSQPGEFTSSGNPALDEVIESTLRLSSGGLADIVAQARLGDTNLLIVVDQFEELFRYRAAADARAATADGHALVRLLLDALGQQELPIYVVITMRSDFLGECAQFSDLPELLNQAQYLVPRMTRTERRLAIVGPARVVGTDVSPPLVTRLLNDMGDDPDQLSLLQHALHRTFERWQSGQVTDSLELNDYEAIGTIKLALHLHAEEAYVQLGSHENQRACAKVFKALTDRVTDPRGVRRPTRFRELCAITGCEPARVRNVVEVFRQPERSFLMPPPPELLDDAVVIDISHESLMRVWHRVEQWAEEEARSAELYQRLNRDSALHERGERSLWRDPELAMALNWSTSEQPTAAWGERYAPNFAGSMAFLNESAAVARRRTRLRKLSVNAAAAVVAGVLLLLAWVQRQRAEAAEGLAQTRQVAHEQAQKEAKLSHQRAELNAARAEQLTEQSEDLKQQLKRFYDTNPQMREDVQQLRIASRSVIIEILETREQNLVLADQIVVAESRRRALAAHVAALSTTNQQLLHDKQQATAAVASLRSDETQLEAQVEKQESDVKSLRKENGRLRAALLAKGFIPQPIVRAGRTGGSGTGRGLGASRKPAAVAVEFQDERLAELERKNAQLRERLRAFQDEARLLELVKNELSDWKERLDSDLEAAKAENAKLKASRSVVLAKIRQLEERHEKLIKEEGELLSALRVLEADERLLRMNVDSLEQRLAALMEEAEALESENERMREISKPERTLPLRAVSPP